MHRVGENLGGRLKEALDQSLGEGRLRNLRAGVERERADVLLELVERAELVAAPLLVRTSEGGAMQLTRLENDADIRAGLLRRSLEYGEEVREEQDVREDVDGEVGAVPESRSARLPAVEVPEYARTRSRHRSG